MHTRSSQRRARRATAPAAAATSWGSRSAVASSPGSRTPARPGTRARSPPRTGRPEEPRRPSRSVYHMNFSIDRQSPDIQSTGDRQSLQRDVASEIAPREISYRYRHRMANTKDILDGLQTTGNQEWLY